VSFTRMQIHPIVLAFALSFASLVAAQSPALPSPSSEAASTAATGTPFTGFATAPATEFETATGSTGSAPTAWAVYYPGYYDNGVSKRTVAAAIGGSFAASLLVLVGAIFCLRYRARKMMVIAVEGGNNADLGRRCDQLESEVRALREQLNRSEAQRLAGVYGGGAVLYTHEKDDEAMGDVKEKKECPPTYAD